MVYTTAGPAKSLGQSVIHVSDWKIVLGKVEQDNREARDTGKSRQT